MKRGDVKTLFALKRVVTVFCIIIILPELAGCSKGIIQYKPVSKQDTILMIGNNGGNAFYLDSDLFSKEDSIYLQIVESKKHLSVISYEYSEWGSDSQRKIDSNKFPEGMTARAKNKRISSILFTNIKFTDDHGNIRRLGDWNHPKEVICYFHKLKHRKTVKKTG